MKSIGDRRSEIYDFFHTNMACKEYFFAHEAEYVAYYNSMYLLQDSTESLHHHRERGFSSDPLLAYLEFWGVMQAVIIQQDSISEIHAVIRGEALDADAKNLKSWLEVRKLRNVCAGHPAKKDRPRTKPLTRTFMGRAFGGYSAITFEQWKQGDGTTHPRVNLGALLDSYAIEAEAQLASVLAEMKSRWP